MKRKKTYRNVHLPAAALAGIVANWEQRIHSLSDNLDEYERRVREARRLSISATIERGDEAWYPETLVEFITDYARHQHDHAYLLLRGYELEEELELWDFAAYLTVTAKLGTDSLTKEFFLYLDGEMPKHDLPRELALQAIKKSVTIFVGHGRDGQWRDLKSHLSDTQGFTVKVFESGARAGYTATEVLRDLSEEASFALLVHTAEDERIGGGFDARANVIHETGLFQGKLGLTRAIVMLEDGCSEYSNIAGLQQIRFAPGHISATYGDVVATILREFGGASD